jgi:hypothetical protein
MKHMRFSPIFNNICSTLTTFLLLGLLDLLDRLERTRFDLLDGLSAQNVERLLDVVTNSRSAFTLGFEGGQDRAVVPADLRAEITETSELTSGLQTQDTEGLRNNNTLHFVIRVRNTFENLNAFHGSLTTTRERKKRKRKGGKEIGRKGGREGDEKEKDEGSQLQ